MMDGRYPTETDYDYKSEMIGTDFIRISSTDSIFTGTDFKNNWNPKVGIMFVIAVLPRSDYINYSINL